MQLELGPPNIAAREKQAVAMVQRELVIVETVSGFSRDDDASSARTTGRRGGRSLMDERP